MNTAEFDTWLSYFERGGDKTLRDAGIHTFDYLYAAQVIAKTIFGPNVAAHHVFDIYDRLVVEYKKVGDRED